ncbi:unnamed protein product [Adineta ricciae]|uniref:MAPEG family protein n=1 Tax=Adineta ricciae TaxID=249248 RepID=A0A815A6N7_ADIRI|nr:unnamed protein product [Adineta ricciae]
MARYDAHNHAQLAIFGPFFATMLLTVVVWVYMYIRRIHFLLTTKLNPQSLVGYGELQRISPPAVNNPSDNLKNLFEIPVLFYALTLYLFVTGQVDQTYVVAAWIFTVFRVLHSIMHCSINIIIVRFYLYLFSCISLFFMLFRAMLTYYLS